MNTKKLIVIAATAALVCAALAQGGGGQRRGGFGMNLGDPVTLLGREDVQKDLVVTDDEKAKIVDLTEKSNSKRQEAMQAARDASNGDRAEMMKAMGPIMEKLSAENWAAVGTVITADQVKRLKEISVQIQGAAVVTTNKEVQGQLSITDDQKAKFADLRARQQTAQQELFQKMQSGEIDRSQMPDIMKKNTQIMEDEINKILTDAQKAKLKDLGGKHFERVDPPRPGGGR